MLFSDHVFNMVRMMRMNVVETTAQSSIICRPVSAAMFAATCNLLSFIFENYQFYYLEHYPFTMSYFLAFAGCISLAPLLVVIVFRHSAPIIFIYASILFLSFTVRTHYLLEYLRVGVSAFEYKLDPAGLLLFSLGVVSLVVVLILTIGRLVVLIGHNVARGRSTS